MVAGPLSGAEPASVDWSQLPDPVSQEYEDPYRDLTQAQFEALMTLARVQIELNGSSSESEREQRATELSQNLRAQGLDPEWILAQRDVVAERRKNAAFLTNSALEGAPVELTGYLLAAPEVESGEMVAYLVPDRGVCMHLPPPVPNQLVRLDIDKLPEPLGPCINARVRGRLSASESAATVPIFDDTVQLWSSWRLDVSKAITSGSFSSEDNES